MTHVHDFSFFSLRALLPELLTFAYTPANYLKFNGTSQQPERQHDVFSDYATHTTTPYDEDEHVLVLEMDDSMVRKKRSSDSQVSLGIGLVFQLMLSMS
jgi:hypothetical protein